MARGVGRQVLEVLVAEGAVPSILGRLIGGDVSTGDDLGIDENVLDGEDVVLFRAPLADAVQPISVEKD